MVRIILAVAAVLAAGTARADDFFIGFSTPAGLAEALAELESVGPGDRVDLDVSGFLLDVVGEWESDTARMVGMVGSFAVGYAEFDIPLPNFASWDILGVNQIGVLRGGDGMTGENGNVTVQELNAVRNFFGATMRGAENDPGSCVVVTGGRGACSADVNYDYVVNIDDLNTVRNHFGENSMWRWEAPAASVPEPSAMAVILTGLFVLSTLRRRSLR